MDPQPSRAAGNAPGATVATRRRRRCGCRGALGWLLALLLAPALSAAPQAREYDLKAEFLERFTRFVEWPEAALPPEGPFVMGVFGRDPFDGVLRELASRRRVQGRPIEVRQVKEAADARRCHLLFLGRSEKGSVDEILELTRGRPVLTVGDRPELSGRGVLINFFVEGKTIGFEIDPRAVEESGLAMSSRLLKLARLVPEEELG